MRCFYNDHWLITDWWLCIIIETSSLKNCLRHIPGWQKHAKLWNILDCGSHCRSLFCGTIPTIRPSLRRNDVKIRKMVKDMTVKMDGFSGSGYKVLVIKEPPLTTKKKLQTSWPRMFFFFKTYLSSLETSLSLSATFYFCPPSLSHCLRRVLACYKSWPKLTGTFAFHFLPLSLSHCLRWALVCCKSWHRARRRCLLSRRLRASTGDQCWAISMMVNFNAK